MNQEPNKTEADNLMSHEYDGIREYDNPTPGWWHMIFLGCCLFALVYFVVFHMTPAGKTIGEFARYDKAVARAEATALDQLGVLDTEESTLLRLSTDEVALSKGAAVFATNCIACHKPDGSGMIGLGPNLTDHHGKTIKTPGDVYTTIANGIAGTAMVAWEQPLGQDECILAAAYVISLRGTNAPNGKEPEGEIMPEWSAATTGEE